MRSVWDIAAFVFTDSVSGYSSIVACEEGSRHCATTLNRAYNKVANASDAERATDLQSAGLLITVVFDAAFPTPQNTDELKLPLAGMHGWTPSGSLTLINRYMASANRQINSYNPADQSSFIYIISPSNTSGAVSCGFARDGRTAWRLDRGCGRMVDLSDAESESHTMRLYSGDILAAASRSVDTAEERRSAALAQGVRANLWGRAQSDQRFRCTEAVRESLSKNDWQRPICRDARNFKEVSTIVDANCGNTYCAWESDEGGLQGEALQGMMKLHVEIVQAANPEPEKNLVETADGLVADYEQGELYTEVLVEYGVWEYSVMAVAVKAGSQPNVEAMAAQAQHLMQQRTGREIPLVTFDYQKIDAPFSPFPSLTEL